MKDFFRITLLNTQGPEYRAALELNPEHPLYRGHFPGRPVLPGVCSLQMIKEAVAVTGVGKPLQYAEIIQCKFLSVVNPQESPLLDLSYTWDFEPDRSVFLRARLKRGTDILVKLKARLTFAV